MADSLQLPETIGDQSTKRSEGRLCVRASHLEGNVRALPTTEQEHAHDAFRIRDLITFAHLDVRLESVRQIDELRSGPRVKTQAIWNLDGAGQRRGHEPARCASRWETTTS